jgi:2-oxoisovalerate dehydrogenase E1 component
MALRAARSIQRQQRWQVRVVDLRWLVPLNTASIVEQGSDAARILIVDEGRSSAGISEGVLSALVAGGLGATPMRRVTGADTFTPLAEAARLVLPGEADIVAAACALADRKPGAAGNIMSAPPA